MTSRLFVAMLCLMLTAAARGDDPALASPPPPTLQLMNQRMPEITWFDQPFDRVLDELAQFTNLNIVPRWQVLADAGVQRDKPISLHVRNLRLAQVLWLLMNEASGPDLRLAYRVSGNLLTLSTADDLGRELVTKVYDVADLLLPLPQTPRPSFTSSTAALGPAGGPVFPGNGSAASPGASPAADPQAQIRRLVEVVEKTIEPDSWARANPGAKGHIEVFGHLLIVHNTILVHQQLGGFLAERVGVGP